MVPELMFIPSSNNARDRTVAFIVRSYKADSKVLISSGFIWALAVITEQTVIFWELATAVFKASANDIVSPFVSNIMIQQKTPPPVKASGVFVRVAN